MTATDSAATPAATASGADRLLASPLTSEIEFLNARARAIGSAVANARLREFGLRVRSYSVLTLSCGGLEPTQRQLAEFLRLDPSQIVSLVDELESAGLVQRKTDPTDRRSKVIVATAEGERVRAAAARAAAAAEDIALGALDPDEREELRRLMTKVAFAVVDPAE